MSTSNLTYKDYSFAKHKEVYLALEESFKAFNIHYYLIGANARDIALYNAGNKPYRATGDIDFAIMVPNMQTYNDLKKHLEDNGFQCPDNNEPYRLYFKASNTIIDLLPYGDIAEQELVSFKALALELSVVGMLEVGEDTEQFQHPEDFSIPVSPAHGIVILKLIAWSEKPNRTKDIDDIKVLLAAAWDLYQDELFIENSPYADLFEVDDFDTDLTAARVMGRKMQAILNRNEQLKAQIIEELEKELKVTVGRKAQIMASKTNQTIAEIKSIFKALLDGIKD